MATFECYPFYHCFSTGQTMLAADDKIEDNISVLFITQISRLKWFWQITALFEIYFINLINLLKLKQIGKV